MAMLVYSTAAIANDCEQLASWTYAAGGGLAAAIVALFAALQAARAAHLSDLRGALQEAQQRATGGT